MKTIASICILALGIFLASPALADEGEVVKVSVTGMTCVGCSSSMTQTLKKLEGVTDAYVSIKHNVALIKCSGKMKDDVLQKAVKDAGYEPGEISRVEEKYDDAKSELEKTS